VDGRREAGGYVEDVTSPATNPIHVRSVVSGIALACGNFMSYDLFIEPPQSGLQEAMVTRLTARFPELKVSRCRDTSGGPTVSELMANGLSEDAARRRVELEARDRLAIQIHDEPNGILIELSVDARGAIHTTYGATSRQAALLFQSIWAYLEAFAASGFVISDPQLGRDLDLSPTSLPSSLRTTKSRVR